MQNSSLLIQKFSFLIQNSSLNTKFLVFTHVTYDPTPGHGMIIGGGGGCKFHHFNAQFLVFNIKFLAFNKNSSVLLTGSQSGSFLCLYASAFARDAALRVACLSAASACFLSGCFFESGFDSGWLSGDAALPFSFALQNSSF